jgi:hypothetical protein
VANGFGLARFDGETWMDDESLMFYDLPGGLSQDQSARLTVAPDGALWVVIGGAVARFDPESPPDEAWTVYTRGDGLQDSHYHAMAFGPGGEFWFGATQFQVGERQGGP